MTPQEIAVIIKHARSAPLRNMDYAAAIDQLLTKLEKHFEPPPPAVQMPNHPPSDNPPTAA